MTCWFLSFLFKRHDDDRWHPQDATTHDEHPLDYIARARRAYREFEYRLLFFHLIPEDTYRQLHPEVADPLPVGAVPQQTVR